MRILVTGGAGFIGSHVVDVLLGAGHEVHVIDDLSSGARGNVNPSATFHHLDLRDEAVPALVRELRPQVINHHAAQVSVSVSVREPQADASINLMGLLNLISGVEPGALERVVFASSGGTVYGDPPDLPAVESFPLDPRTPYGIAKAASEWYLRFLASEKGFKTAFLRYSNVYGPRQSPHGEAGVVAIFTQRLLAGQPCTIHGDGEFLRDYVYVGDVARASLLALGAEGDVAVNIGTGIGTTVNRLYELLAAAASSQAEALHGPPRPGDLRANMLDPALAGELLGWRPEVSLAAGLKATYGSFKG